MTVQEGCGNSIIKTAYNAAWLIPIILTYTGTLDYRTGFVAFTIITALRLSANLYRNNVLKLE